MPGTPLRVLSIAGHDPTGRAGLIADLRLLHASGCAASAVATCQTVQTSRSVTRVQPADVTVLREQIRAVFQESAPQAIKIGLVPSQALAAGLAEELADVDVPVVWDPVLRSTSGTDFLTSTDWNACLAMLAPVCQVVVLNCDEADVWSGRMPGVGSSGLFEHGRSTTWVFTGGDAQDPHQSEDLVHTPERVFAMVSPRVSCQVRGTGCQFSTALALSLAKGNSAESAAVSAKMTINLIMRAKLESLPIETAMRDGFKSEDVPAVTPRFAHAKSVQPGPRRARPSACHESICGFPAMGFEPGVYPVVPDAHTFEKMARAGVRLCQLRIKGASAHTIERELDSALRVSAETGCRLVLNDHWSLALQAERKPFALHLGQEDLDSADLEGLRRAGVRLGISTHDIFELARALTLRPSYIALGPIFPTTCKAMRFGPQGFGRLSEWRRLCSVPLVAIGGLKAHHIPAVRAAGADGAAVIADVLQHPQETPVDRVRHWLGLWSTPASAAQP